MLVKSIFSFSDIIFHTAKEKFLFLNRIKFFVTNAFILDKGKILSFGTDLTHYQTTKF